MALATLLINILMAALLMVTIGYCWVLNRRIKVLQDSKSELATLLGHFDESTLRASESIVALQTASKKIGENIQLRIDKANYLLDDLSFLIEKGNKLTHQMEAGLAVSRARSRVIAEQEPEQEPEEVREEAPTEPVLERKTSREKTAASLEAVLGRVIGRSKSPANDQEKGPRSQSEQELLNILKAGLKG